MPGPYPFPARLLLIASLAASASGCGGSRTAAVAAGAAAAGAAIVLNDQNAEADVSGSVADVDRRTQAVFSALKLQIARSASEDNQREREYEGRSGDRVVHVKLEQRSPGTTKVSVSSRAGTTMNYDVSHARMVLERIQRQR